MRKPSISAVFLCGLVGTSVQTLLFRQYMIALDARDSATGLFFGASFLWMALGVWILGKSRRCRAFFQGSPELSLLAYISTAFCAYGIIVFLRGVAGAESYSVATVLGVLGYSVLVTAPVCLLTGFMVSAFRCSAGASEDPPMWYVCGIAAIGAAVGGIGTTGLLYAGASVAGPLVALSALACGTAVWMAWTSPKPGRNRLNQAVAVSMLVVVAIVGFSRVDVILTKAARQQQWARAVPAGTLEGSFSTTQTQYLYGADGNDWVVTKNGRIYETVGDASAANRIAAMALAQNTEAEHVLVVGRGLSLCAEFLKSPNITTVEWFTPDQQYAESVQAHLPPAFAVTDPRFQRLTGNLRDTLTEKGQAYDIVLIDLPDVISATANPLLSVEFFEQTRQSLHAKGLVVVNLPDDSHRSDTPSTFVGASVKRTLDSVFDQTILAMVDDRVFLLSAPGQYLQISPLTLQVRFAKLENAAAILPPEELVEMYIANRNLDRLASYDVVALPREMANSDDVPHRYLGQLLQSADTLGISLSTPAGAMLRGGLTLTLLFVAVLGLVRLVYVITTTPRQKRGFDPDNSSALQADTQIATGGSILVGSVTFLALIYLFQTRYGSVHLYMGLFLGLGALGLALGLAIAGGAISRRHGDAQSIYLALRSLAIGLLLYAACLVGAGFWVSYASLTYATIAVCLILTGLFCGAVLAAGTAILKSCHVDTESVATKEVCTATVGAASGSALAGFLLIPLLGPRTTFFVLAALLLTNVISLGGLWRLVARPGRRRVPHPVLSPLGFSLFALATCIIVGRHFLSHVEAAEPQPQPSAVVAEWAEGRTVSTKTIALEPDAREVPYHEVREGSRLVGYVFRSEDFSETVYGYGGPMAVVAFTDPNGTLIDFRVTRHRETPRYFARITNWLNTLKGNPMFGSEAMAGVNTVSGATRSTSAVLRLLRNSGQQFSAGVFGQAEATETVAGSWFERINRSVICWVGIALLALAAAYHGRLWSRLIVLGLTVGAIGFWLNKQFSTDHVTRLLGGDGLLAGSIGGLCLLLGVPLLLLLFGNLYCGYLCPFGALQELIGLVLPKRFKPKLPLRAITVGRSIKYVVLFVLVVAFVALGDNRALRSDPLTSVFDRTSWSGGALQSIALIVAIVMLVGTLFVTRLWCRYLCPTGAFLSLFNRVAPLRKLLPPKKFGRCEFGLSGRDHFDCIHCDRCRYQSRLIPSREEVVSDSGPAFRSWLFLILILAAAAMTISPTIRKAPAGTPAPSPTEITAIQAAPSNTPTEPVRQRFRRRRR